MCLLKFYTDINSSLLIRNLQYIATRTLLRYMTWKCKLQSKMATLTMSLRPFSLIPISSIGSSRGIPSGKRFSTSYINKNFPYIYWYLSNIFLKKINHRESLPWFNKTFYLKFFFSIFICFSVYPLHTPVLIWVHSDDYLGVGGHWGCITLLHWWLGSNGQELEQPVGWSMKSDHKTCFNSE